MAIREGTGSFVMRSGEAAELEGAVGWKNQLLTGANDGLAC